MFAFKNATLCLAPTVLFNARHVMSASNSSVFTVKNWSLSCKTYNRDKRQICDVQKDAEGDFEGSLRIITKSSSSENDCSINHRVELSLTVPSDLNIMENVYHEIITEGGDNRRISFDEDKQLGAKIIQLKIMNVAQEVGFEYLTAYNAIRCHEKLYGILKLLEVKYPQYYDDIKNEAIKYANLNEIDCKASIQKLKCWIETQKGDIIKIRKRPMQWDLNLGGIAWDEEPHEILKQRLTKTEVTSAWTPTTDMKLTAKLEGARDARYYERSIQRGRINEWVAFEKMEDTKVKLTFQFPLTSLSKLEIQRPSMECDDEPPNGAKPDEDDAKHDESDDFRRRLLERLARA